MRGPRSGHLNAEYGHTLLVRVLLIEDFEPLARSMAKGLREANYAVDVTADGAEGLAVEAWHGLEHGAQAVEHAGEVVADAVGAGAREIAEIARTAVAAGKQLAHYAAVGAHATGEAVSDVASGTVMAASAAGKTLMALV